MTKQNTSIQKFVSDRKDNLAHFAIRDYNQSEFLNSITIAVSESKHLMECLETQEGRNSMFHALKLAAHTGLSLSPQKGEAALVAFKGRVSYLTMKNGLIKLAMESGKVEFLTSETVRENDQYSMGKSFSGDTFSHVPAKTDRGKIIGFYAGIKLKSGSTHLSYMTAEQVAEHGQNYSAFFGKSDGPWKKSFEGMGKKTVIKSLFRNLHISDDTTVAVRADDEQEAIDAVAATVETSKGANAHDVKAQLIDDDEPEIVDQPASKQDSDLF